MLILEEVGMEERNSVFLHGKSSLLHNEVFLFRGVRAFLYFSALGYCFIGLSVITARFFRSMEKIVKQTREITKIDPYTNTKVIKHERVWNYAIADISLLAFGTSFPQISLATIDAIRNIGQLNAGASTTRSTVTYLIKYSILAKECLFKAVSVFMDEQAYHAISNDMLVKAGMIQVASLQVWSPKVITIWEASLTVVQFFLLLLHAYAQDKRWLYLSIPINSGERPEEWVPREDILFKPNGGEYEEVSTHQASKDFNDIVDIFSIHSDNDKGDHGFESENNLVA
ncbi:Magnesium/proton exchanger 1 [Platanthera guangdongensis]|uniref:Magnesium/proton exchanger 1 n=1 Tax=Platanthera guangdongensis TaxID=2320717 RepID=A0ABR2MSP1_9ASPA